MTAHGSLDPISIIPHTVTVPFYKLIAQWRSTSSPIDDSHFSPAMTTHGVWLLLLLFVYCLQNVQGQMIAHLYCNRDNGYPTSTETTAIHLKKTVHSVIQFSDGHLCKILFICAYAMILLNSQSEPDSHVERWMRVCDMKTKTWAMASWSTNE
jgi:hypothetical protein